ncbi:hypothetical protein RRG08_059895 [Elysia crispata]|uniref:Uncharacterized protein n=1 Tax=Elysia crispata TaxID=231223 RepID=A0AAE1CTC3_9GAST|nr:hypothetical protein RRG08_059895 [Elysia crispata]
MKCVVRQCLGFGKVKTLVVLLLGAIFIYAVLRLYMDGCCETSHYQYPWEAVKVTMFGHSRQATELRNQTEDKKEESVTEHERVVKLSKLLQHRLTLVTDREPEKVHEKCQNDTAFRCNPTTPCSRPLETRSPLERVRGLVSSPWVQLSQEQLSLALSLTEHIPDNDIIIASSCSDNHFNELQAMFKNLRQTVFPKLQNFTVIVFDLGLTERQRVVTESVSNVVTFPFKKFPKHVQDVMCYSWKPIIMAASMARARKLLVYQDSSIRWNHTFHQTFQRALLYGQQAVLSPGASFPGNTLREMFEYMEEEACPFRPFMELQGGIHLIRRDPLVIEAVLHPWLKCALEKDCMCPKDPQSVLYCYSPRLHRCHRFDQSAFNLIMSKLYGVERYKMTIPRNDTTLKVDRKDRHPSYLYELKYGSNYIMALAMPMF